MSDETWCGQVSVSVATGVADVECVPCLDALIRAAEAAQRRKTQLARNDSR